MGAERPVLRTAGADEIRKIIEEVAEKARKSKSIFFSDKDVEDALRQKGINTEYMRHSTVQWRGILANMYLIDKNGPRDPRARNTRPRNANMSVAEYRKTVKPAPEAVPPPAIDIEPTYPVGPIMLGADDLGVHPVGFFPRLTVLEMEVFVAQEAKAKAHVYQEIL